MKIRGLKKESVTRASRKRAKQERESPTRVPSKSVKQKCLQECQSRADLLNFNGEGLQEGQPREGLIKVQGRVITHQNVGQEDSQNCQSRDPATVECQARMSHKNHDNEHFFTKQKILDISNKSQTRRRLARERGDEVLKTYIYQV